MAGIKLELDEYLARNNNDTKPLLKTGIPVSVNLPKVSGWFKKNEQIEDPDGWYTRAEKSCCPTMTKLQRITGFSFCVLMGLLCFGLSALYIPVLILKARKFALLYTLGSLFLICSFSFLWGPISLLKHLFSTERLGFTVSYISTLGATLYCSLVIGSTPLTVLCAVAQLIALLWFLMSYIPGGHTGLMFFTKIFSSAVSNKVSKSLPV